MHIRSKGMGIKGRAVLLSMVVAVGCVNAAQRSAKPNDESQANLRTESEKLFALANQARAQANVRGLRFSCI